MMRLRGIFAGLAGISALAACGSNDPNTRTGSPDSQTNTENTPGPATDMQGVPSTDGAGAASPGGVTAATGAGAGTGATTGAGTGATTGAGTGATTGAGGPR
jgi:hypothetical protein